MKEMFFLSMRSKNQNVGNFFSELQKSQIQFSDLSSQEQGCGFGVLVLKLNTFSGLEDSVFLHSFRSLTFAQKQERKNIKVVVICRFPALQPTLCRGFHAIPCIGHKCCVKGPLARATRSGAAPGRLSWLLRGVRWTGQNQGHVTAQQGT